MPAVVRAHLVPTLVEPEQLCGRVAIVIDVLRATTTIIHALAAGAECVIPCLEVEEARQTARKIGPSALLGGERGGVRIDGFDFGNSPTEYVSEKIAGRTIVFSTTNGTRAMLHCRQAAQILIGAFVNRAAVVRAVNTGISAVIDGDGAIREPDIFIDGDTRKNADKPPRTTARDPKTGAWYKQLNAALIHTVPLDSRRSLYVRYGDWFAMACAMATLLVAMTVLMPKRVAVQ